MSQIVMVNPSSGDRSASLFAGPDASSGILNSVPKGTMLKVTGSSGNFYTVEYDSGLPNTFSGGTDMSGTIIAYPSAPMYSDKLKTEVIGNVNNGTSCEIINDLHPIFIEVEAVTTQGKKTGYVEVKYIFCGGSFVEEDQPIARYSLRNRAVKSVDDLAREVIRGNWGNGGTRQKRLTEAYEKGEIGYDYNTIQKRVNEILRGKSSSGGSSSAKTGVVIGTNVSTWDYVKNDNTGHREVGSVTKGSTVTIYETKNGWYRIVGSSGTGDYTQVWVPASAIKVDGTDTSGAVSKNDVTVVSPTSDGDNWVTASSNFSESNLSYTANDEYYKQLAIKYSNALGCPPKYNSSIDVRYMEVAEKMDEVSSCGRVINKTILSNPSILSICPGKVKMFPNLMGAEKDSVVEAMKAASEGNSNLKKKIEGEAPGRFSGRLYKFEADTAEYAKYLNSLCRACAILLGIGDEIMPETETKLKHFDYAYWSIRKKYNPTSAASDVGDGSLFRNFGSGLVGTIKSLATATVDDTSHINFFLNGNESNISEAVVNSASDGPLANLVNPLSETATKINYFIGSGFDVTDESVGEALEAVIGSSDGLSGLKNLAENFAKGGRMVLPKMVDGSRFDKSISCSMKFVSPYGDKLSVFLRCLVPICHLMALSFPKQVADNMYTFPFLVRCSQPGHFNVDLGIIGNITINRGGSDDTSWTIDTIATEWDVQIDILPLVDNLMITSTDHPLLFVKNEMLLDYLGNYCGFDLYANNLNTKIDLMMAFVLNKFAGIPHAIENKIADTLYNKLNPLFRLSL